MELLCRHVDDPNYASATPVQSAGVDGRADAGHKELRDIRVHVLSRHRRRDSSVDHARPRHLRLSSFSILPNLHLARIDRHLGNLYDRRRRLSPHVEINRQSSGLDEHLCCHCLFH